MQWKVHNKYEVKATFLFIFIFLSPSNVLNVCVRVRARTQLGRILPLWILFLLYILRLMLPFFSLSFFFCFPLCTSEHSPTLMSDLDNILKFKKKTIITVKCISSSFFFQFLSTKSNSKMK